MAMSYSQNLKELKQLCEYLWDADFEVDGKTVSILPESEITQLLFTMARR